MMGVLGDIAKRMLRRRGIEMVRSADLDRIVDDARAHAVAETAVLSVLPEQYLGQLMKVLSKSKAQLKQDLFVLGELDCKRNGFFVELARRMGSISAIRICWRRSLGGGGFLLSRRGAGTTS
jgi:hypothetical protein